MFLDSQEVLPLALLNMQWDVVDCLPAAAPLIMAFYLADARADIKVRNMLTPPAQILLPSCVQQGTSRFDRLQMKMKLKMNKHC